MMKLKRFSSNELVVSKDEAKGIFTFFFDSCQISTTQLTNDDRAFAQALMVAAVDASNDVGLIHSLWEGSASPSSSIISIAKSVVRQSITSWWKHRVKKDVVIYDMVKTAVKHQFITMWQNRLSTGDYEELDYRS